MSKYLPFLTIDSPLSTENPTPARLISNCLANAVCDMPNSTTSPIRTPPLLLMCEMVKSRLESGVGSLFFIFSVSLLSKRSFFPMVYNGVCDLRQGPRDLSCQLSGFSCRRQVCAWQGQITNQLGEDPCFFFLGGLNSFLSSVILRASMIFLRVSWGKMISSTT